MTKPQRSLLSPTRSRALTIAGAALVPLLAAGSVAAQPKPAPAPAAAPTPAAPAPATPAPAAPAPVPAPATTPAKSAAAPAPAPAPAKPTAPTTAPVAAPAPVKPAPPAPPPPAKPAAAPAPAPAVAGPAPTPAPPPAPAASVAAALAPTKPSAPPAPKPAAELDTFKSFIGKWRCEGKQFASPLWGPEHPIKASAEAKLEADNFWQSFSYEEKKTKDHPGLKMKGLWGYDQGSKRFVRAGAGSHGEWDTASATGWEGDKLIWTGELSGPAGRVPFHQTFTKKGDREWTQLLEVRGPDGKWSQTEEVTCKR